MINASVTVGGNADSVIGDSTVITPGTPGAPGTPGTPGISGHAAEPSGATASVSSTRLAATGGTDAVAAPLMGLVLILAGGVVVARRRVA